MVDIGQKHFSLMIMYAIGLHFYWGVLILVDENVANVAAIHSIRYLLPYPFAALSMLSAAILAMWAFFIHHKTLAALMMVPQQFLLFVAAGGAVEVIVTGHFVSGESRPVPYMMASQGPALFAAICHTLALIGVARRR